MEMNLRGKTREQLEAALAHKSRSELIDLIYEINNSKQLAVGYYLDSSGIVHGCFRDANGTLHFPIAPSGSVFHSPVWT
jgi:hypothetical protein